MNLVTTASIALDGAVESLAIGPDCPLNYKDSKTKELIAKCCRIVKKHTTIVTKLTVSNSSDTSGNNEDNVYEKTWLMKDFFPINTHNVCLPTRRVNRSQKRNVSLNGTPTKVVTVKSPIHMLTTDNYKNLFAVPIIRDSYLDSGKEDDQVLTQICFITKTQVIELLKHKFLTIARHNHFLTKICGGKVIDLRICNFDTIDKDCDKQCQNLVIQFVNDKESKTRQIITNVENDHMESWEREGVTLAHCTLQPKVVLDINSEELFYKTLHRTYCGRGYGSRSSAQSMGMNVYQGSYLFVIELC